MIFKILNKLFKYLMIGFFSIIIFLLFLWGCVFLSEKHDAYVLEKVTLNQLKNNADKKAYSTNKKTFDSLKNKKITSVKITSDNQGGSNYLYYASKINGKYYGLTFKPKYRAYIILSSQTQLRAIVLMSTQKN